MPTSTPIPAPTERMKRLLTYDEDTMDLYDLQDTDENVDSGQLSKSLSLSLSHDSQSKSLSSSSSRDSLSKPLPKVGTHARDVQNQMINANLKQHQENLKLQHDSTALQNAFWTTQAAKLKTANDHEQLKMQITQIRVEKEKNEMEKQKKLDEIEVERQRQLAQIEIDKQKEIVKMELDLKRKQLGL